MFLQLLFHRYQNTLQVNITMGLNVQWAGYLAAGFTGLLEMGVRPLVEIGEELRFN